MDQTNLNDGVSLIREHELWFDSGDPKNGSLYLCRAAAHSADGVNDAIARLRSAGLWSDKPAKFVEDKQKPAYEAQMRFVEAAEVTLGSDRLVLARFDHPKFPSSAERFAAWKKQLGA